MVADENDRGARRSAPRANIDAVDLEQAARGALSAHRANAREGAVDQPVLDNELGDGRDEPDRSARAARAAPQRAAVRATGQGVEDSHASGET